MFADGGWAPRVFTGEQCRGGSVAKRVEGWDCVPGEGSGGYGQAAACRTYEQPSSVDEAILNKWYVNLTGESGDGERGWMGGRREAGVEQRCEVGVSAKIEKIKLTPQR